MPECKGHYVRLRITKRICAATFRHGWQQWSSNRQKKKVRKACDRLGRCLGHAYIQTCTASMEQQQGEICEEWRQLSTCLG